MKFVAAQGGGTPRHHFIFQKVGVLTFIFLLLQWNETVCLELGLKWTSDDYRVNVEQWWNDIRRLTAL